MIDWTKEPYNNLILRTMTIDEYCNMLEKALDKACEKLAFSSNEDTIQELGSFHLGELNRTKKEWIEWAMKDE